MLCVNFKLTNEINYLLIYVECHEVLGYCQSKSWELIMLYTVHRFVTSPPEDHKI